MAVRSNAEGRLRAATDLDQSICDTEHNFLLLFRRVLHFAYEEISAKRLHERHIDVEVGFLLVKMSAENPQNALILLLQVYNCTELLKNLLDFVRLQF